MIASGDSSGWLVAGFFGLCLLVAIFEPLLVRLTRLPKSNRFVTFDSVGFKCTQRKWRTEQSVVTRWDEIQTVTVFKRDLFTVDCICLFAARNDDSGIELDEEMCGWQEFVEAMPTYLRGCMKWEDWFLAIVSPAFAIVAVRLIQTRRSLAKIYRSKRSASQLCSFCAQLHLIPTHSGLFQPMFAFFLTLGSRWVQ